MKPSSIKIRDLTKRFGDRVLLSIDEFSIAEGECILVTGDNGSGKTTFLKILSGLVVPESAKIVLNGDKLPWKTAPKRLLRDVVYLHQEPYMLDTTVERNVAYGLRLAKFPRSLVYDKVSDALRSARLDHLAHRNAQSLSAGEKQRVALTRARILNPRILALDEPTANMDQQSRISAYQLVDQLRDEGMAIVVASHDHVGLEPLADHHIQLIAGKLVRVDSTFKRRAPTKVTQLPVGDR